MGFRGNFCRISLTKNPGLPGLFFKRLMGLEPTTFCMASRRSGQLSYSREGRQYSPGEGYRASSRALAEYLPGGRCIGACGIDRLIVVPGSLLDTPGEEIQRVHERLAREVLPALVP